MENLKDLIREFGPYVLIGCGVLLALHGKDTAGLVTGGFALVQAATRPTGGSKADPETK